MPWRSWYALGLMFVVYVFNFLDRSILGILAQPIKEELQLSDTQMGFMGGIAFAIFYTFVGIPIARMADKSVRRNVLSVCLALWSGMTVLCGFAASFTHLLLARIGVSVGNGDLSDGIRYWDNLVTAERRILSVNLAFMEHNYSDDVLQNVAYLTLKDKLGVGLQWRNYLTAKVVELESFTDIGLSGVSTVSIAGVR